MINILKVKENPPVPVRSLPCVLKWVGSKGWNETVQKQTPLIVLFTANEYAIVLSCPDVYDTKPGHQLLKAADWRSEDDWEDFNGSITFGN